MYTFPYLLLKHRITTTVTEVKECTLYADQDSPDYKGGTVIMPAVYIRFLPTDTRSLADGKQEAELEFEAILLMDCVSEPEKRIYNGAQLTAMKLADKLHAKLSGHSARLSDHPQFASALNTPADYVVINSIDRVNFAHQHDNRSILRITQRFRAYVVDLTAAKRWQKAVATLGITALEIID